MQLASKRTWLMFVLAVATGVTSPAPTATVTLTKLPGVVRVERLHGNYAAIIPERRRFCLRVTGRMATPGIW